jgi:hypothetical protein
MNDKQPPKFRLVTRYDVRSYECGLQVGDIVRLKHDIVVRYKNGKPSGEVRLAGEESIVLPGSTDDPGILWLRNATGERWTWDDNEQFFDSFEIVRP